MSSVTAIMKMQMNIFRRTSICCLAVIFLVASALNVYGSVWCIEDDGHAKMEFACIPCCSTDDNKCSAGNPGVANSDHAGCENDSHFPAEELGRSQPLSTKLVTGEFGITAPSVSPGPLSTFVIEGGCYLGPPVILHSLGAAQASLEVVVLRC